MLQPGIELGTSRNQRIEEADSNVNLSQSRSRNLDFKKKFILHKTTSV